MRGGSPASRNKFLSWLSQAEARVTALHSKRQLPKERLLLREAEKCESLLQSLFAHAERTNTDLTPHVERLTRIQTSLYEVRLEIESRKQSVWRTVLNRVSNAFGVVADLLGLSSLGSLFRGIRGFLEGTTRDD